jgi:hypothetical protein
VRNGHTILVGKHEEKRAFETPKHRQKDVTDMKREVMDYTGSRCLHVADYCKHDSESLVFIKCREFLAQLRDS